MMKVNDFIAGLKKAAESKTLYIKGCFGSPMTAANKRRYTKNNIYNTSADRVKKINAASKDTFGFDCVCLIKGILWGWDGSATKTYGGAQYLSNGIPDVSADGIIKQCAIASGDFKNIVPGALLWMKGHVGVYIGDGLAIECTPIWKDGVQYSAVGNIGKVDGYPTRTWSLWGLLPWVDYTEEKLPKGVVWTEVLVENPGGDISKKVRGINLDGNWYVRLRDFDDILGIAKVSYDEKAKKPRIID